MRDANAPPVLRSPTEPTLWSFTRALWSSGRGWAVWPVRVAGIAVSLGGGFAILLAPTIRWPVAAGVAVLLFLMLAVASFLLWQTEVLRANAVSEMLEPRFRIVPVVVPSADRVRAVVEVVNDSRARNHNLRVAVVAVDRPLRANRRRGCWVYGPTASGGHTPDRGVSAEILGNT